MKDSGMRCEGAKIRVHIPDHSKDKAAQSIKAATESFLQKIMLQNARATS